MDRRRAGTLSGRGASNLECAHEYLEYSLRPVADHHSKPDLVWTFLERELSASADRHRPGSRNSDGVPSSRKRPRLWRVRFQLGIEFRLRSVKRNRNVYPAAIL